MVLPRRGNSTKKISQRNGFRSRFRRRYAKSLTVKSLPTVFAFLTVLTLSLSAAEPAGKAFLGAIPVQYVTPNEELVLDMHRFFHPTGNEKLELGKTDDVDVSFDPATFQLRARAKKPGVFNVEIKADEDLKTILTLASSSGTASHRFSFKPPGSINKVFLAGSFNGWSTDKLALTGPSATGEYAVDVPLKPGRYSYKFVVDGKWTLDPNNSETEDNGMGDKNSVVVIAGETTATAPIIYADRLTSQALFARTTAKDGQLAKVSAIFEGASETTALPAKIKGEEVEVSIPSDRDGFVRVIAANGAGIPSNVVRCPVGAKQSFHWQDSVLYYAFTDRFADGDKSNDHPVDNPNVAWPANFHGGDLRGITQKIDEGYFDKIGANTIWVAPLNKNPAGAYQEYPEPHRWYTGYHGYWPISSTELDPHIGTDADLHKLVETAHARGMKVIADLVLHHVHQEHPWWKEHRDWFGSLDLPGGKKNLRLWDEQQFTTWFEPYLPSFDFSKDEPVRALIDNSVWWANTYKLDGFRLDAVKHVLPSFWWKFRAALREKVDSHRDSPLYLVGETFKDRAGIMSFVGPNMLDGQFDFPLYDQIKETFGQTNGGMKTLDDSLSASERSYGKETLMSPLVGNHDKGRFMAYADRDLPAPTDTKEEEVGWKNPPTVDDPSNYTKLELAQAFLMSIDGVPMVYYGDEIGMTGAGDPDNRRDMRFDDKVTAEEKGVLENFQKLGALRRKHPALRYGSRRALVTDQDLYAFVRAHLEDRIVVIFNRGKSEAKIDTNVSPEMPDGDYTEALSGKPVAVKDGKLQFSLPAQTAAFVTKR
jgi:cyclomaltodextrinase / maltogenic alpha-amylase / neopullulanase